MPGSRAFRQSEENNHLSSRRCVSQSALKTSKNRYGTVLFLPHSEITNKWRKWQCTDEQSLLLLLANKAVGKADSGLLFLLAL
jgi:hypothetical protein